MSNGADKTKQAYYRDAASWSVDWRASVNRSERRAWWVAAIAGLIALAEAVALIALMPLKTVVPYTLLVDRQTGFVQTVDPLDAKPLRADAALTQSYVVQYVLAREGYAYDMVQADYRKVVGLSDEAARSGYVAQMAATNPSSPLNRHPKGVVIRPRIKSVSPISATTMLVRFDTVLEQAGVSVSEPQAWAAVVRYRYVDTPASAEERYMNPLGFRVVRYQRDPEVVAAPSPRPLTVPTDQRSPTSVVRP